jgi:hypothetical protein
MGVGMGELMGGLSRTGLLDSSIEGISFCNRGMSDTFDSLVTLNLETSNCPP